MEDFTQRVLAVIRNIPTGKVMTYGQVATVAGNPRAARQVVRILHSMSKKHHLPWHRVINAKGEIGVRDDASLMHQILTLESEGVTVREERYVNLEQYQFRPEP